MMTRPKFGFPALVAILLLAFSGVASARDFAVYQGERGPGKGKNVVFLSGDEEYRSEEALPVLAKILAVRHGFKCTVLFAINPADGTIDPVTLTNMPGMAALDLADLCIMGLRFRELPDEQMKHFVDYLNAGKPFVGLRTATHSFQYYGGLVSQPSVTTTLHDGDIVGLDVVAISSKYFYGYQLPAPEPVADAVRALFK
jgi:hypothetical protein